MKTVQATISIDQDVPSLSPCVCGCEGEPRNLRAWNRDRWYKPRGRIVQSAAHSGQMTIKPYHHRTVMTPDSPVGGFIRFDFSQDDIELVPRVFGTQVLRRSFQPLRCSGRLRGISAGRQSNEPREVGQSERDIPLSPKCVGRRVFRRASRYRSLIVRLSHGSSSLGWRDLN